MFRPTDTHHALLCQKAILHPRQDDDSANLCSIHSFHVYIVQNP